jgi:hypothetical protein
MDENRGRINEMFMSLADYAGNYRESPPASFAAPKLLRRTVSE